MLSAVLALAIVQGIAIWMPRKENMQGFPVTVEEKLRFTAGNIVAVAVISAVAGAI